VDGYARILLEDFGACLDAEGRRICAVIGESGRTMGKLIDNLLAFSRIGRVEMQRSSVDMTKLVQSVFLDLTSPGERDRITLTIGPLPPAHGDSALVRQVWTHLLSNAVKFSARKKQAEIEVSCLPVSKSETAYFVRDNGAGFDMAYADKLFRVFHSLHSPREFEGMGAGLAIVQRIVHRHGGRIWAEGETGKGATFYFTMGASFVKRIS